MTSHHMTLRHITWYDVTSRDMTSRLQVAHQKILELQNQRLVIMNLIGNAKATVLDNNSEEDLTDEEVPVSKLSLPPLPTLSY